MPTPNPGEETRDEWMDRCIPVVIDDGTAEDADQASAICSSMWDEATKGKGVSGKLEYKNLPLVEVKQLDDRQFEGHAAVFGNVDLGGDVIIQGAFKRSLRRHRSNGTWPPMFWMHNPTQVPGLWTRIEEDGKGLFVKGELVDTQLGNETRTLLMKKAVRGLSIGFMIEDMDFDKEGNRLLKEIDLWEASIVSLAMNPMAAVEAVKSLSIDQLRDIESSLREGGLSWSESKRLIAALKRVSHRDDGSPATALRDEVLADEELALQHVERLSNVLEAHIASQRIKEMEKKINV